MFECNRNDNKRPSNIERVGRYRLTKTIGRGNFAVVKLGKHDVTRTKVAVKIINKTRIDEDNMRKIYREIRILKTLKHRHIIELYQVMESETKLFLIMEYASGGEVLDYVRKRNRMNEREARRVFRQVISAVAYCHSSGVVHRDLKLDHMLFSANSTIKLVDFGFSNFATENTLLQTWCGSPQYAAPELFLGEQYDGQKADIWSLGVILYALVCGGWPFPSSLDQIRSAVLEGHISLPFYVSAECADLLRKMLTVKPQNRLNVRQVMQHRWFRADDWDDEWESLMRISLNPELIKEDLALNYTCLAFMQQRGYLSDKTIESVVQKRFDDEYATYQLLCAKLKNETAPALNAGATLALNAKLCNNGVRRGSRGSITTGRVDFEPASDMPLISTIDLAKLGLSSSEEESSSSDSDSSATPSAANMQNYLSQRRHTALGVPAGLGISGAAPASASGNVGFVPPVPYPLVHNLAEMSNLTNPFVTSLKPPLLFLPKIYPDANGPVHFPGPGQQQLMFGNDDQPKNEEQPTMGVEEAGALYLTSKKSMKRHTVHGFGVNFAPDGVAAPFPLRQQQQQEVYATGFQSSNNGRFRNEPYLPAPASRRGSDFCHLTSDDMRHLEKLYQNAIQRSESPVESMRHLQQEFHQLKATTEMAGHNNCQMSPSNSINNDIRRPSPRASPPGPVLDMIIEQETVDEKNKQPLLKHRCESRRFPSSLRNAVGKMPTIEITDDFGALPSANNNLVNPGNNSGHCPMVINDVEMKLS